MTGGVVVVLGETGRNFAAGMSGGIAYVYDPNNTFKDDCNVSMVELESIAPTDHEILDGLKPPQAFSISADDSGMGHMLNYDAERLHVLIERHQRLTNSVKATNLLNDWEVTLTKFVKVMPKDYRRALLELQTEESATVVAAE